VSVRIEIGTVYLCGHPSRLRTDKDLSLLVVVPPAAEDVARIVGKKMDNLPLVSAMLGAAAF